MQRKFNPKDRVWQNDPDGGLVVKGTVIRITDIGKRVPFPIVPGDINPLVYIVEWDDDQTSAEGGATIYPVGHIVVEST